jgi:nucleotide-binding universal stress UspA family protein
MVRFKKILCPVDLYKPASRAFDYAAKLAANYGAALHLLHVVVPVLPPADAAGFTAADITARREKEAKRTLKKMKERMGDRAPVSTEVRVGDVDSQILSSIHKGAVDLVVMGTHAHRGFERLVMGSTAERMIRRCPVPMIIMGPARKRSATPPDIRRILVTTDFSEGTAEAVDYALSIAQECQAKLTLLHVLPDIANVAGKYRDSLIRGIETQLQKLIPDEALNWCDAATRVETGLPFKRIPTIVRSGKFDLLVMNIHGKSLLDRALLGSTAERSLRASVEVCPVMLIPPQKTRKPRQS